MADLPNIENLSPLTEDEKALLRRCCWIKRITDDEIVFSLGGLALGKATWWTFFWFLWFGMLPIIRWTEGGDSVSWVLLGVFPFFLIAWLAARMPAFLVIHRGARAMTTILHDGTWTIKLPHGTSPADWGFPTASVPARIKSDEMERVEAWAILEKFSGSSLSEKSEDSDLTLLAACNADVLGYDEKEISISNTGSSRMWVAILGLFIFAGAPAAACFFLFFLPSHGQLTTFLASVLSVLGALVAILDGRPSSVTTFKKGKREVSLFRRKVRRTFDVREGMIRVISDSDGGELVGIPNVFLNVPTPGTASILADFLNHYLAPPKKPTPAKES